ncbi:hypothetical protein F9U42_14350 [Pectobacterium versatile]|uniref:hypothetical protein n=1 Tax=Pectobacterium versatile TaxID=2488639 RepID=UPI001B388B99|nr:hypothetical protein [Pectobacterium versatile]MBQ4768320.1 hypothetical protein [Pectobacterium versatile]
MTTRVTKFCGLITFDANHKHASIIEKLTEWEFNKNSLHGRELPSNTYLGVFEKDVVLNDSGNFSPAKLEAASDYLSNYYRAELKDFFNENDIDGEIYVLFSWLNVTDDSVTN